MDVLYMIYRKVDRVEMRQFAIGPRFEVQCSHSPYGDIDGEVFSGDDLEEILERVWAALNKEQAA